MIFFLVVVVVVPIQLDLISSQFYSFICLVQTIKEWKFFFFFRKKNSHSFLSRKYYFFFIYFDIICHHCIMSQTHLTNYYYYIEITLDMTWLASCVINEQKWIVACPYDYLMKLIILLCHTYMSLLLNIKTQKLTIK